MSFGQQRRPVSGSPLRIVVHAGRDHPLPMNEAEQRKPGSCLIHGMKLQNRILHTLRAPAPQARPDSIVTRVTLGREVCAQFGFADGVGSTRRLPEGAAHAGIGGTNSRSLCPAPILNGLRHAALMRRGRCSAPPGPPSLQGPCRNPVPSSGTPRRDPELRAAVARPMVRSCLRSLVFFREVAPGWRRHAARFADARPRWQPPVVVP